MSQDAAAQAFRVRTTTKHQPPNVLDFTTVDVKQGRRVFESATILTISDEETGEIKRREFKVQTFGRSLNGPGFSFEDRAEHRWYCEDREIEAVRDLLNNAFPTAGVYQFPAHDSAVQQLIAGIDEGRVDAEAVHRVVTAICNAPDLAEALARMDEAGVLADVIERNRQLQGLRRWRQVVEDPASLEGDIQKVLDQEWWVFGGRYIKADVRRQLVPGDEMDLLLVRSDGSLHVVEIKQANIPKLIREHRSHYRVGNEVHEAVSQAANYLRSLDEQRDFILNRFKVDPRRASATVVIGHPMFVESRIPQEAINEAIRTYNSHLSRIEVMTFADLIEGAEGSFALTDADGEDEGERDVEEYWPEPEEDPWPEPASYRDPWDDPPF
ncbi:Shedu anti-phage system protein SduA domain-containing protein [Actinoplanes sp. M2I2]|uniref:Shedu anti-phage system protein SduA domain-containing protein n=1 Tax=Actinoplanes sp. M2I2 TaxID=1734444 RepID=UPI002021E0BE|nr:Shedu anti-phage system protein SduA domain-containing protein [Actinoplanes sp. M2I2]